MCVGRQMRFDDVTAFLAVLAAAALSRFEGDGSERSGIWFLVLLFFFAVPRLAVQPHYLLTHFNYSLTLSRGSRTSLALISLSLSQ